MVSLQFAGVALAGLAAILAVSYFVYRDADRVGMETPRRWAAVVCFTVGIGFAIYLSFPDVPIPGLLVITLSGPVVYAFERDDAKHGDVPADPRLLPDGTDTDRSPSETESAGEES